MDYLAEKVSLETAENFLDKINAKFKLLGKFPQLGRRRNELYPGLRSVPLEDYLISCPEYNGSITPLLKNTIDWASRPELNEKSLSCFKGKVAALLATSPGGLGGIRGLVHVRAILEGIGVLVIPEQKAIPHAPQAFDESGQLKNERQAQGVMAIAQKLTEVTAKLSSVG